MIDTLNQLPSWLYFLNITLVMVAVLHMFYQRRSPQNLMAWLLALLLLPFIGILLYTLFGSRKLLSKRNIPTITMDALTTSMPCNTLSTQLTQLLQSNHLASTTHGNQCTLYETPSMMYQQLMHEIEHAHTSIHLQTYIFQMDQTGHAILNALIQKAQQGIQVCLLMDAIGSFSLYRNRSKLQLLVQAGGQYAFFQPLFKSLIHGQINLRNHRKIYLFDQSTLLTGGINLAHNYLGLSQKPPQAGYWQDLMLKAQGPISTHFQNIFNADWLYTTNQKLPPPPLPATLYPSPDIIQTIPSGPDIYSDTLFETLLHAIYSAKNTIQIITPYFIPDSAIMNALLIAIKRGVTVKLITPKKSDHLLFDLGRCSYIRELAEQGGHVYYHHGTILHAKLTLIDQDALIFGSANLDYRSLFINHEIVNILYSKRLILQMQTWINTLHHKSQPYQAHNNKLYRYFENLTRIFTPLL